jgi:hypothetical protein
MKVTYQFIMDPTKTPIHAVKKELNFYFFVIF